MTARGNSGGYALEKPVEETVIIEPEVAPHVARITLNRPEKHNALYPLEGFQEVERHIRELSERDDVKVIVLRGAGPSFCTGDDLNRTPFEAFGGVKGQRLPQSKRIIGAKQMSGLHVAMMESPKPIVVQAHGTILGVGFQLVLLADLVVAADTTRFSRAEQRIGFGGQDPFTHTLSILTIGLKRTRELLLTGRTIDAATALDWGLVNEVVAQEGLDARTLEWATAIAAHATDGIVIGRVLHQLTLEALGVRQSYTASLLSHPLFTNLVWREDEWNFLKERDSSDRTGDAFAAREHRWQSLGGF
jgi:enoyl-CoA hydratase/carnithine racemase